MTPEEARTLLDRLKHAGNVDDPVYAEAADTIIPMLETIANMHYEYAVQVRWDSGDKHRQITTWHQVTEWSTAPNPFRPVKRLGREERIIRRLVSQPEVMEP